MKNTFYLVLLSLLIFSCKNNKQNQSDDLHQNHKMEKTSSSSKKTLSPHKSAMAMIGDAHIHIDYSSPSVRGRMIYGGLLAYGEVWQSGAHNATWIETNKDIIINENLLKAGKYGFFTIPNKDSVTFIVNSVINVWGSYAYSEENDVLRVDVPMKKSNEQLEAFSIAFGEDNGISKIYFGWDKMRFEVPFSSE